MPKIDDSIRKIDSVICRHLDSIEDSSRGAISQDILEQLMKFVNHIMLKFYANGSDIEVNEENIAKATEFAQVNSDLHTLYKFRNYLNVVTTQYTLDEDGSERLMLKYYQYLLEAKNLLSHYYNIEVLYNIEKFPLHLDDTLQEYYTKISEKLERYPRRTDSYESNKYYIQKIKPLFVNRKIYYEVTFAPVDDRRNKSKSNRVIAFTKLPIKSNYASRFHLVQESIEVLGKTMPIIIIDGWEVAIRDCEFKNFAAIVNGDKIKIPYPEQRIICEFITSRGYSLNELIDFPDIAYAKITNDWKSKLKSYSFIPVLDRCREIIQHKRSGQNILRYLLYNMNNVIIKNQYSSGFYSQYYEEWRNVGNSSLSYLYLSSKCRPFDNMPFNQSPSGHNPRQSALFECIPCYDRKPELFARFIRNNTVGKGQLFTDISELSNYPDYESLIKKYNDSLSDRFRPVIHNNMKGIIKGVEIVDAGTPEERIQFDVEIPKAVDERDISEFDLELLENYEGKEKSLVRFYVHKLKSADEEDNDLRTIVPFQIAYAVSIHKAQGLEYDSVKIVITDEVEELVTHNIFYTAITRARKKLKIYWTPEVEEKVINRIKPRDISKDVELLKKYLSR